MYLNIQSEPVDLEVLGVDYRKPDTRDRKDYDQATCPWGSRTSGQTST